VSRLLHVIGTGLVLVLTAFRDVRIFLSLIAAASVGTKKFILLKTRGSCL
jgi:hypothetical protein